MTRRHNWLSRSWGDLASLRYGRALSDYKDKIAPFRVFGTNGPIGWHDKALFSEGVVVGRKGAYRGIHYSASPCWVIDTAFHLEIHEPEVDARWAYYQLRTVDLNAIDSGSAIPSTSREAFAAIPVQVPPLPTQRRVVAILDAIDHLIENNRRRIELLEKMTQATYREWFVHFRYPGHEDATFVESPLGPIPEGWEVTTLGDLINVDKGLSYKGVHLTESGTPMANLKCFRPGGGFRRSSTKPYSGPFKPKHEIVPGDLIIANTDLTQAGAVIGSPAFIPKRGFESGGIISHHLFAVRGVEPAMLLWLYQVFCEERFRAYARGVASGTTVLGFRPADLLAYRVACPPQELSERFGELAGHFTEMFESLNDSAGQLAAIRDLLLPKLVTGQIDVSELDLDTLTESVA